MPFGLDANFSEEGLVDRLNADLANDLGNLVSRATTLIANLGRGVVASPGPPTPAEESVHAAFNTVRRTAHEAMEEFAFHRALAAWWEFIGEVNRYVDATQPWQLAKQPAARPALDRVLYTLGDALRLLGIVLAPFVPHAASRIMEALGNAGAPSLADAEWGGLRPGTRVQKLSGLFPRVETKKASEPAPAAGAPGDGPRISIDEFRRLDLRVAEVLEAEPVPKSKKLLKLTVSLGTERRTLVAGIAEHYRPEELRGRKVVVVANLEPATLMGVQSNGMVLAGSEGEALGLLALDRDLPPGAKVR
jgi:methionyl-tRNA synthetase